MEVVYTRSHKQAADGEYGRRSEGWGEIREIFLTTPDRHKTSVIPERSGTPKPDRFVLPLTCLPASSPRKRREERGRSRRQDGRPHQRFVDGAGGLAAFADRPDHKRLAPAHVARRPEPVHAGAVIAVVGGDVDRAAAVGGELHLPVELLGHATRYRTGEAVGDEGEVGADDEFGAGDRLAPIVDFAAFDAGELPLFADEFERRHLELPLRALGLAGRGPHLGRPIGPDGELVLLLRRLWADVELGDAHGALAEGGADAVRRRVAAADHHDMHAAGEDRLLRPGSRLDVLAAD